MPIYEYRCPNGHTFEVFQRMSDAPVEACTVCGEAPVEKLLFPVAVHFKGSGFYSTDYGRKGQKAGAKDGESASVGDKAPSDTSAKEKGSGSADASPGSSSETKPPPPPKK